MRVIETKVYEITEHPNKELCYKWMRENFNDLNQSSVDEVIESLKKLANKINGKLDFAIGQFASRGEFITIKDYDKDILDSLNPEDTLTGLCWDYDVISGMQSYDLESVLNALHEDSEHVYSDEGLNDLAIANEYEFTLEGKLI